MARRKNPTNLLPASALRTLTEPGKYADGGGLYLQVSDRGTRSWLFVFRWRGRRVEMGLGRAGTAADDTSLAAARDKATQCRIMLDAGTNPLEERRAAEAASRTIPTFGDFADDYVKTHGPKFKNTKHRAQWEMTLGDAYCKSLRPLPVDQIDTEAVLRVLTPIWTKVPETANRLRGRIENVLDAAKAKGFRSGENPAAWRGHLKTLLPARQKLTRGHMAAMPFADVPAFVARLRDRDAVAARALEFLILAAARSGEVREASWGEIDIEAKVWTVPPERMKIGREHRVPLTPRMIEILEEVGKLTNSTGLVFPGAKRGKPFSDMAFGALLDRMEVKGATAHGFRSSFRDWCGEATTFPRELAEAALAHSVGDETEAAYRRGDALERRRKVMLDWEKYLAGGSKSNVVPIRPAATA